MINEIKTTNKFDFLITFDENHLIEPEGFAKYLSKYEFNIP